MKTASSRIDWKNDLFGRCEPARREIAAPLQAAAGRHFDQNDARTLRPFGLKVDVKLVSKRENPVIRAQSPLS